MSQAESMRELAAGRGIQPGSQSSPPVSCTLLPGRKVSLACVHPNCACVHKRCVCARGITEGHLMSTSTSDPWKDDARALSCGSRASPHDLAASRAALIYGPPSAFVKQICGPSRRLTFAVSSITFGKQLFPRLTATGINSVSGNN